MIATFVPSEISISAAVNSSGPPLTDLIDPIPFPLTVVQGDVLFNPAPSNTLLDVEVEPSGAFAIRDVILFDIETVPIDDPDAPHSKGKQKVLAFAGSRTGAGKIAIVAAQMVLIRLAYQAGMTPGTQTGRLVVKTSEGDTAIVPLSLKAFDAPAQSVVATTVSADHFSIHAGEATQLTISVQSVSGPAADVSFEKSSIFLDAKVSMQALSVHVEPGQTVTANLNFTADAEATLGTFDVAIQQFAPNHLPFLNLRVTVLAPPVDDQRGIATQMIRAKYQQIGERLSPLGRPLTPDAPVQTDGNMFFTDYRGGRISFSVKDGVLAHATFVTTVRYKGIHCFGKSEAVDEPYAIVGVYTPDSTETTITKKFPVGATSYTDFVASTDASESIDVRTMATPQDIAISCTVMEHDSGDPDRAAAAVEGALKKAAGDAGVVDAADISVFTGVLDDLKIPGLIANVLGVGDDVIGSQTLQIHYTELEPKPPMQQFGNIFFNFQSPLLSDGDASYKIYFEVFTQEIDPPRTL